MKPSETPSAPASIIGHVKDGVVVIDTHAALNEGQAVRIEPLQEGAATPVDKERAERIGRLQQLFADWTEEDGKLPDEEADRLHEALLQAPRVAFRFPRLD